jgi:hypothetical protein
MKLVKENLYEKHMNFTENNTDPIEDMGISAKKAIDKWLKNKISTSNYRLTKKFSINVFTTVILENQNLHDFPEFIKFNHIVGGFHIKRNNLTTLRGCPFSVTGSFIASRNKLKDLKNGPLIVQEQYGVSHNLLKSLEGIAEKIGGSIYLNDNPLTTLKYIPQIIKGDLNIQNTRLKSLDDFPDEIEGNLFYTPSDIMTVSNIRNRCKIWGHVIDYSYKK